MWNTGEPTTKGSYLVTIQDIGVTILSYAKDLYKVDDFDFGKYKGKKHAGWYDYDSEYGFIEYDGIIAWQELPEPYKEADDDKI